MNKTSLERLKEIGRGANTQKMEELLQMGKAVRGMTNFDLGEILSYIQENHDQARAMVALAASGYALSGSSTNYLFGVHLGLLATLYLGAYQSDPRHAKDCKDLFALLKDCVPNLYGLMSDFEKEITRQLK
jgi:hypothetical protein